MERLAVRTDTRVLADINYGRLLMARGDFAGARARFQDAADIDPGNPNALLGLAGACRQMGQPDAALSILRNLSRSIPMQAPPSVVPVFESLGQEFAALGHREEAINEYRRALSFFEQYLPDAPRAKSLRQRIAELGGWGRPHVARYRQNAERRTPAAPLRRGPAQGGCAERDSLSDAAPLY